MLHSMTAWFVRNPVAANLLMLLLILAGIFTITGIRIEGFPTLPPSSVSITANYPGATAQQVDQSVTRRIERSLEGMPGIKKVAAISEEGFSTIWIQKTSRYDLDRLQNDIKIRIDAIPNLPQQAERPVLTRDEFSVSALLVQVYGDLDEDTLQQAARLVKKELLADPVISKMETFGDRSDELRIEVDSNKLEEFGISIQEIGEIINQHSLEYQTGTLKSDTNVIRLRADKKAYYYQDFINIPVISRKDGTRICLGDVATVIDGFEDEHILARYQGQTSVGMMIYTTQKGHLMEVSKAAKKIVESLGDRLPDTVHVEIWGDYSVYMKARLLLLQKNAWQGLLIVFFLLALFLNWKLAFWVAMGIPISIAGALTLMGERFLDYSLNDITTFGLIIVLGILVDDAIVVGESVFQEREKSGKDPESATIKGVGRVATATVFGCFTTVAAFYPLLLIDNELGKIFASFSVIVIVALLFSLLESKLILPSHLAAVSISRKPSGFYLENQWKKLQQLAAWLLATVNSKLYQPLLRCLLKNRYTTLMIFITLAIFSMGMVFNGQIRTVFFPEVPGDIITIKLKMVSGSPLSLTMSNVDKIEKAMTVVNQEAMEELNVSDPPMARIMTAVTDSESAEMYVELQPEKKRALETMEAVRRFREKVGQLEGTEVLTFSGSIETAGSFIIEVVSQDEIELKNAVAEVTRALETIKGVHDIRDDLEGGESEIRLVLKEEAVYLGLSTADLAVQIGNGFGGLEIQRLQRESEEVKVIVKYEKNRRQHMYDLLNTRIQTPDGKMLPLSLVADLESGYTPASIYRRNGNRTVQVIASLDKSRVGAGKVFDLLKEKAIPEIEAAYPGTTVSGAGELEEEEEMKAGMIKALIIILVVIYALLAVPLKSYWQPLVIMSVIPFGFAGAILGHKIVGIPVSILSFFGMLALGGVVVNDSLVMLTCFNDLRNQGIPLHEALVQAGAGRFRAIFLTTMTTSCGLMPIMLETSEQAQYLIPAAVSLAFGELFATPITLVLIPVLIQLVEDGKRLFVSMFSFSRKKERLELS